MSWSVAIRLFAHILVRFGDPGFLARQRKLARLSVIALRRALNELETLLRALLTRAALALPEVKARPRFGLGSIREGFGRGGFADDDPAAWGVSFSLAGASRGGAKARARRRRRHRRLTPIYLPAAPVAERLEAIARVFADPNPYVRRMARLLQARMRRPLVGHAPLFARAASAPLGFRSPDDAQHRSGVQGQGRALRSLDPGSRSARPGNDPNRPRNLPRPDE